MNPLWIDARDYLTSQGQPITTHGLNEAMNLLASNPQLRPSAVKAGGGANGIAVGLGAPTDQIISTPLAPPASQGITATPLPPPAAHGGSSPPPSKSVGRGKQGASGGSRTAGGTSASSKTVKDVPAGVGNVNGSPQTPMGRYTSPAPPSQPSSPVGVAQADTGRDDGGFLAHLMDGNGGRIAAIGGALATALGAYLLHRGGSQAGSRPINSREGEVIPPDRVTVYGQGRAEGPIINGDPIQQLLGGGGSIGANAPTDRGYSPTDPLSGSPLDGADQAYGSAVQRAHNALTGPQSFEDMISQLAAQAPGGARLPPPAARPPIPMGDSTSGPTINMPPTGGQQLMDILRGLGAQ